MTQKLALAVANSPFFQLALDVGMPKPPPLLRIAGESASEVGMAFGAALILGGSPPAIAAGIAVLAASLAARRKLKGRK